MSSYILREKVYLWGIHNSLEPEKLSLYFFVIFGIPNDVKKFQIV